MTAADVRKTTITAWQGWRHYSDELAAQLAGVSKRTWYNWKNGGFDIPVSQLTTLCIRLKMPKEDIKKVLCADYPGQL